MKTNMTYTVAALAASLALLGCDQSKQPGAGTPATNSAAEAKKEIKEAAQATKDYVVESKDQFVAATQEKLNKLDQQISELGTKTENLKDEAKADSEKAVAVLREQRMKLGETFDEVKSSTKEKWQDVKAGFESALTAMEKAYEDAKAKFKGYSGCHKSFPDRADGSGFSGGVDEAFKGGAQALG